MSFISGADLQAYCPNISIDVLDTIAESVENMFCDLLPLRLEEREKSFEKRDVFFRDWWYLVMTSLLNIESLEDEAEKDVTAKISGHLKQDIHFKWNNSMQFDPLLILNITSWYSEEDLPARLKQAMIDYAVEKSLTQWSGITSNVSSYKMWPRTISFREWSTIKDSVMETIRFYQPL